MRVIVTLVALLIATGTAAAAEIKTLITTIITGCPTFAGHDRPILQLRWIDHTPVVT
jgi:hypothetical protein